MNFVADEGIDLPIVTALRQGGHKVWYIAEISPAISDEEVLQLANEQQAILVTFDKDFGKIIFRQSQATHGIVLLRLHGLSPQQKALIILETIRTHGKELINSWHGSK